MQITVETITPTMAAALLEMNTKNRPLSPSRVSAIKNAIKNGEWKANGDAIRISESNVLLDGQTRLSAIVSAGVPVQSVIIRGLPDDVFSTIDINGAKRNAADILAIRGVPHYKNCAAIALSVLNWEKSGLSSTTAVLSKRPTTTEVEIRASTDLGIQEAASFAKNQFLAKMVTVKIAGYVRYLTYKNNPSLSDAFFDGLIRGVDLHEGSPVLLLRDALIKDAAANRKMPYTLKVALCIYAYKTFCEGRTLKMLKVTTEGNTKNIQNHQGI